MSNATTVTLSATKHDELSFNEYEQLALQTVSPITDEMRMRIDTNGLTLRGVLETLVALGNDVDRMKKHLFYGKMPENGMSFGLLAEYEKREQLGPRIENFSDAQIDVLHAAFGIIGEGCEAIANILKPEMLNDPFQKGGIVEEAGDAQWYLSLMLRAVKVSLEDAARANNRKLLTGANARYLSGSFSQGEALNRDYDKENESLRDRQTISKEDIGELHLGAL